MKSASLLRPLAILVQIVSVAALLTACSTMQQVGLAPAPTVQPPMVAETVGTGQLVIGVLSFAEPLNRSGGAADATALAAKLAAQSVTKHPVSVVIRPQSDGGSKDATAFEAANARLIVGGNDARALAGLAKAMAPRKVPTIALASLSDTASLLYGAGLAPREEAAALVAEAKRLGYAKLGIVAGAEWDSASFATAVADIASTQTIAVVRIDAARPGAFQAELAAALAAGKVDALVFAVDPQRAAELIALADPPTMASIAIVGNAGWTLAEPLPSAVRTSWYPSLPRAGITAFVTRFRAAYNATPTLASAVVYDLVVMAAVLDQMAGAEAFSTKTLQSDLGFTGFTGPFTFGPLGLVQSRSYEILAGR
ncbi:hypothetical protein ABIB57_002919 [Devosia sp. UYZn731]|uniref:hypothetical protein n=1 Tax=Devosia sp. UYZn731 TaxID=3156345 RepID=UPI00339140A0